MSVRTQCPPLHMCCCDSGRFLTGGIELCLLLLSTSFSSVLACVAGNNGSHRDIFIHAHNVLWSYCHCPSIPSLSCLSFKKNLDSAYEKKDIIFFWVWLLSLHTMIFSSIFPQMTWFKFYRQVKLHCVYSPHFLYPFTTGGQLAWFHGLAIADNIEVSHHAGCGLAGWLKG